MQACNRIVQQATCPIRVSTVCAVSWTLSDPDEKNCAEQMHGSHALGWIRALGKSAVVRTAGGTCSNGPELIRLQDVSRLLMRRSEIGTARTGSSLQHTRFWQSYRRHQMATEPVQSPLRPIFLCSPSRSRCQESCDLIKCRNRILS